MGRAEYVFGHGSLVASRGGHVAELRGHERRWGVAMDNTRDLPGYKYYLAARRRPARGVRRLPRRRARRGRRPCSGVCTPVDAGALAAARRARAQLRARRRHGADRRPARPDLGLRRLGGGPRALRARRRGGGAASSPRTTCASCAPASELGEREHAARRPRWTPAACPCTRYGASTSSPASLRSSPWSVARSSALSAPNSSSPSCAATARRPREQPRRPPASGAPRACGGRRSWTWRSASPAASSSSRSAPSCSGRCPGLDELLLGQPRACAAITVSSANCGGRRLELGHRPRRSASRPRAATQFSRNPVYCPSASGGFDPPIIGAPNSTRTQSFVIQTNSWKALTRWILAHRRRSSPSGCWSRSSASPPPARRPRR